MTYLEAYKIITTFAGGPALPFLLGMSGTASQLEIYLRAAATQRTHSAQFRMLPFGTLTQYLHAEPAPGETEVFLRDPVNPAGLAAALDSWFLTRGDSNADEVF